MNERQGGQRLRCAHYRQPLRRRPLAALPPPAPLAPPPTSMSRSGCSSCPCCSSVVCVAAGRSAARAARQGARQPAALGWGGCGALLHTGRGGARAAQQIRAPAGMAAAAAGGFGVEPALGALAAVSCRVKSWRNASHGRRGSKSRAVGVLPLSGHLSARKGPRPPRRDPCTANVTGIQSRPSTAPSGRGWGFRRWAQVGRCSRSQALVQGLQNFPYGQD